MDTRIYVMTHKEYVKPQDDIYRTLHVGKAFGNDFGYEGDDTGDNISLKNRNYCELTGIYWLWKNVKCDIVGICHYRRYMVHKDSFLDKGYIEDVLKSYDVIVPNSSVTPNANLWEQYAYNHSEKDMQICRDVVEEKYPDYVDAFDLCMSCNYFSVGNMVITRKDIFDRYCEWLFDILFEVEKRVDISGYDVEQSRIFGFLSERLLRVWLLKHSYRIREEEMRMVNPEDVLNKHKEYGLKYRYVNIVLGKLLAKYKVSTDEPVFCSEALPVDFGGKVPVWVLWLEGHSNAPEPVRVCVNSIYENIPKDIAQVYLLDIDNISDFIRLPDWIIDKVNRGIIPLEHFSEIIKMGLLYRYGGLWIDAGYYADKPISKELLKSEFYTLKYTMPEGDALRIMGIGTDDKRISDMESLDITKGRWSGDVILTRPGAVLAKFVLEALYEYWRMQEQMIDNHLTDYVIALAYDNLSQVKDMIDVCLLAQPNVFALAEVLNGKWSNEYMELMTKDTNFFKIPCGFVPSKENIVGQKTFYGYLAERVL